jgi:hypothetical protein
LKDFSNREQPGKPVVSDGGQPHGRDAAAGRAIGVAAKLARFNELRKIRRGEVGSLCEDALVHRGGRIGEPLD